MLLREEHAGQPGDAALTQAINAVRARGGIAIVIAHRRSALAGLDQLLLLANGQVQRLAPRRTAILFDIVVVWACLGIVGSPWRRNWFGSTPDPSWFPSLLLIRDHHARPRPRRHKRHPMRCERLGQPT